MRWQKTTRLVIIVAAVGFAIAIAVTMRKRTVPQVQAPLTRTDPKAVLEGAGGLTFRVNKEREEVRIHYDKLLTYPDGSSKMVGLKVTTERDGRTFQITGSEGQIRDSEATIEVVGDVRVEASDGLIVTTGRASYTEADGMARAPGAVEFSRNRMRGTGVGFTYDKNQNILTILNDAVVHVVPDAKGLGAMDVAAGGLEFRRNEKILRFDRSMKATREREVIEADTAVAHLGADEEQLESVELRGQSRITASSATAGEFQELSGRDIDLKYGPDGRAIEHALITGDAAIELAGEGTQPGRRITASTVDLSVAPDGATPTALSAKERVTLKLPAEQNSVSRTITAETLDSKGDGKRGLTSAHFFGNVEFAESGSNLKRSVRSVALDVAVGPGFSSIDDARFARNVRFVDGSMTATSAAARYILGQGTLELRGTEPGSPKPYVVNEQVRIDATEIDMALEGPVVDAKGAVGSVLKPRKADASGKTGSAEIRMPSMLKQDEPVNVTADALHYDGRVSRATYTGSAQLWQGDTTIKAPKLEIDSEKGNLAAEGLVTTVAPLLQEGSDGKKERVLSRGTAKAFAFQNDDRRATYTGDAHMNGPEGDLKADRIELFLKPSGDELERVEGYDAMTLRTDRQTTTGLRLTYFSDEGRYLVRGVPVKILDECGRETTGRTLTFFKGNDRIVVDGNEQIRTQTKGKSNCPGT